MTTDIEADDEIAQAMGASHRPSPSAQPKQPATVRPWVMYAVVAGVALAILIPGGMLVSKWSGSSDDIPVNNLSLERRTAAQRGILQPETPRAKAQATDPQAMQQLLPSALPIQVEQPTYGEALNSSAAQLDTLTRRVEDLIAAVAQTNARLADLANRPQPSGAARSDEATLRAIADLKADIKTLKGTTPAAAPAIPPPRPELPVSKRWVLRSISDDRRTIYITEGMNGSFERVAVGENVAGVGKILRVDEAGGQYVAVGQTARIMTPSP